MMILMNYYNYLLYTMGCFFSKPKDQVVPPYFYWDVFMSMQQQRTSQESCLMFEQWKDTLKSNALKKNT